MYKFYNNTGKTMYINGWKVESGEMSPWYPDCQSPFTCKSELGTLVIKIDLRGMNVIKKEGRMSARFENMAIQISEETA